MRKRFYDFSDVHLYGITVPPSEGGSVSPEDHYRAMVKAACEGGADVVQLRDKAMETRALVRLCRDLQAICDQTGTLFVLNDRVDVAFAADIDGAHVGQDDLPVRAVRQILGHRKIVGCSTHSLAQAFQAQGDGADYVSCGPLFATPTKPDYPPVGLELVKQYASLLRIPFVAIGGVDVSNVETVIAAGAERVAAVRAVCGAPDIAAAARTMKEKIRRIHEPRI
ncbi:MAG: thiamine phosphate synthase [Elusimicrobia bacterium]|nr:thiamine phosphate synthase [Elusimicrobiota bacterium]